MTMCDYCGCRRSGPTAELAAEHEHLQELGDLLHTALHNGVDASDVFDEFVRLLQMHAACSVCWSHVLALGNARSIVCTRHDSGDVLCEVHRCARPDQLSVRRASMTSRSATALLCSLSRAA